MKIICVCLIALGACIMLYSVYKYNKSLLQLTTRIRLKKLYGDWINALCLVIMFFFWLGYMGNLLRYMLREEVSIHDLFTAAIFFFGALFVLAMVTLTHRILSASFEDTEKVRAKKTAEDTYISHNVDD